MASRVSPVKLCEGRDFYPYVEWLACRHAAIYEPKLPAKTTRNARISIFHDSPVMDGCTGLLGMESFQDTILVLDFDRNLMWLKKAGD